MNKESIEIINGHDAGLVADQWLAFAAPGAFDLVSAERIELPAQAAALSLAEENATLSHQNEALQRRIDRLTANRKRLHALVAERTHELERVRIESHSDPLTGLENRRCLIDRLPVVLSRAEVLEQEVGLIWFDVDGFSLCNQELGEHCGDQLLQLCARRIATHIKGADTVSRAGDDEFVVILPGLDRAATHETMEKIIRLVRAPCTICGHTISVRVSAGLAMYPHDGESAPDLLRVALAAMRRSKPRFRARRRLSIWPRTVVETQV